MTAVAQQDLLGRPPEVGPGEFVEIGSDERGRRLARAKGVVCSVLARKEEDDWSVLLVMCGKRRVRVVGHTAAQEGQEIVAEGVWLQRPNDNGWRNHVADEIKARKIVASTPTGAKAIAAFLEANVKGVGPALARRLQETFGESLAEVIKNDTERLSRLKGVGPVLAAGIRKIWMEQEAQSDVMMFLYEQDFTPATCRRIYKHYGEQSKQILQTNPYQLARDVRGIGFAKADQIAARLAIPKSSPFRIQAGIINVLQEAEGFGHCGLPRAELVDKACDALGLSASLIEPQVEQMLQDDKPPIVSQHGSIWRKGLWLAQEEIALAIRRLAASSPSWARRAQEIDAEIDAAQSKAGISLASAQRNAVGMALRHRISIITGGPGCGKTTTLNIILDIARKWRLKVELAAPTGKAAQRASEATGTPASTLHRLLKIGPEGPQEAVSADLLVIDESSMIDTYLMRDVLKGLGPRTSLIIVGDVDQLPSVGPGTVLGDLIASGSVPFVKLEVVYRQGKGSLIIENAHLVNQGQMPLLQRSDGDFFFIHEDIDARLAKALQQEEPAAVGRAAREVILDLVCDRLPRKYGFDPIGDMMVLSAMNRGQCGVHALNDELQRALNSSNLSSAVSLGALKLAKGDKIIQTRNNYDLGVFNGDTGRVVDVQRGRGLLLLDFEGRMVEYPIEDVDDLRLAYSITIHKSQGSQAPCVVIPMLTEQFTLLQRNLLYTAITRAQKLCVVVGTKKAVAMAVQRTDSKARHTALKTLLRPAVWQKQA